MLWCMLNLELLISAARIVSYDNLSRNYWQFVKLQHRNFVSIKIFCSLCLEITELVCKTSLMLLFIIIVIKNLYSTTQNQRCSRPESMSSLTKRHFLGACGTGQEKEQQKPKGRRRWFQLEGPTTAKLRGWAIAVCIHGIIVMNGFVVQP